jgi:hypothetical protein
MLKGYGAGSKGIRNRRCDRLIQWNSCANGLNIKLLNRGGSTKYASIKFHGVELTDHGRKRLGEGVALRVGTRAESS